MTFDSIIFSYRYNKVLRGIFVKIPANSLVGLWGRNGSGKTTLLKMGAGLLMPDSGNIFINGENVCNLASKARYKCISYLPQGTFIPSDLSIEQLENKIPSLSSFAKNHVFLMKNRKTKIGLLSTGEKRFLEIVLLFSLDRQFYLLDEPFTGVEPNLVDTLEDFLILQKNNGKGILLTDHNYRHVANIVDFAYLLKDG